VLSNYIYTLEGSQSSWSKRCDILLVGLPVASEY
jgi:hypothetical protein